MEGYGIQGRIQSASNMRAPRISPEFKEISQLTKQLFAFAVLQTLGATLGARKATLRCVLTLNVAFLFRHVTSPLFSCPPVLLDFRQNVFQNVLE